MRPARTKTVKAAKFALFVLLPTVFLFILAESVVRIRHYSITQDTRFLLWGFQRSRTVQDAPGKGYELPPTTVAVGPDAPGGVWINRLGLRGKDFEPKPGPNTLRILALGGSSTWGAGNRDGETWPEFLETKLSQLYPQQKFEVINGGIPGGGGFTRQGAPR